MKNTIVGQDAYFVVKSLGASLGKLRGKNLLITGATGFIGTSLLNSLALSNDLSGNLPCKVVGIGRNPRKLELTAPHLLNRKDIVVMEGDVCTFEFTEPFDYVIHAAAEVDPKTLSLNRLGAADVIVSGTRQILQQSAKHHTTGFLYISSGAVYGKQPLDLPCLSEDYMGSPDIADPTWIYGEAKRYAEILCSTFGQTYDISIMIARPFTFVGPYQSLKASFAVTHFIRSALNGEPIRIEGDGMPLRTYCYGADLSAALWKILLEGKAGRAYNVGAEKPISILELAQKVAAAISNDIEIIVARNPVAGQKPARYIPDITRLKSELGISPKFELDEALARTVAWARESDICAGTS